MNLIWGNIFNKRKQNLRFVFLVLILCSCIAETPSNRRKAGKGVVNNSSTVAPGFGRVLHANPIILSGNYNLSEDANLASLLKGSQDFITNNTTLTASCIEDISNCYQVKQDRNIDLIESTSTKWGFGADTTEFLQVHTFYHIGQITNKFHEIMQTGLSFSNPSAPSFMTAYPANLFTSKGHWKSSATMEAYSDCNFADNAFFAPATFSLCFGFDAQFPQVKFAEDPSVIYHEMGHALTYISMNMRTAMDASLSTRSNLGGLSYDEAGSIGEGIADYFSYLMNQRTHIGEWALGRFIGQSRPLTESDSMHAAGISSADDSRLSYPTYLSYDPNQHGLNFEDIHYAGQIITHYLLAMTDDFILNCNWTRTQSIENVIYLLSETFAELGDITSKGSDNLSATADFYVNHGPNNALEWISKANPINYRRFSQILAKKTLATYGNPTLNLCSGGIYSQDKIEQLLDKYGLLLFNNYNDNGNGSTNGLVGANTTISTNNRILSSLIAKEFLVLDPTSTVDAFILDEQSSLLNLLSTLQAGGVLDEGISPLIDSNLGYNNGNGRISPGEFVGVALNLYNNSNIDMAGIQVLANDWDHLDGTAPCNTFTDGFPSSGEGGSNSANCSIITPDNSTTAPVCFVQIRGDSSTTWESQESLRSNIGLPSSQCLSGSTKTTDCFIKAVKGVDQAWQSKLESKKNWAKTFTNNGEVQDFSPSNAIYFEVNPNTPPGTTFNCRLRTRFTNCEDCYHATGSTDEYQDFEYSGGKPFNIINFNFTVTN